METTTQAPSSPTPVSSGLIARRIAVGCILPAALTPKADWHDRWKHVNAAAGAIAAVSCLGSVDSNHAEWMVQEVDGAFGRLCADLESDLGDAGAAEEWRQIHNQRGELIDGLRKRVGERLWLLQGETVEAVKAMLGAIAERRWAK